ncbi:DMT family transporter [Wolbachia endosymbiont of Pentidionis agamae]|uniref:DMT family transporter n=1 Tax=Wolbachia endosymbiont of Pentidionis agamae TaxID=3110435 RepID=UPI002FD6640C
MIQAWLYLALAGIIEIIWTTSLKYSEGFTKLVPVLVILICAPISLYFLSVSIKTIPLGTSYAIWTGIGAIGAVIVGIILFNESMNIGRLLSIALIVTGIVGVKFFTR